MQPIEGKKTQQHIKDRFVCVRMYVGVYLHVHTEIMVKTYAVLEKSIQIRLADLGHSLWNNFVNHPG